MTAAERGVLLLCASLGGAERPLSMAQFRELSLRAQAHGVPQGDLNAELTQRDVERLGYPAADAEHIAALLSRERRLEESLTAAERCGIVPLTRITAAYPVPLARKLSVSCPPVLFAKGELLLMRRECVSLVGSRELNAAGRAFARRVGRLAAEEGLTLVSGGAAGADTEAQEACLAAGGSVIVFTPGRLTELPVRRNVLYLSEGGWTLPFSVPRAMSRNRLIHAMGEKTLVAQTGFGSGGTWNGTLDNLRHGWSTVFVHDDGSEGAAALIARGAEPAAAALTSLRTLEPSQARFCEAVRYPERAETTRPEAIDERESRRRTP